MTVPTTISDLSTSAILNSPQGTDPISNTLDDYLRAVQGILKSQFAQGAAITVSGSTITVPETGSAFAVSASVPQTVTSLSSNFNGRFAIFEFQDGNITLQNGSNLVLPFGLNHTPVAGEIMSFISKGSGVWQCVSGSPLTGVLPVLKQNGITTVNVTVY